MMSRRPNSLIARATSALISASAETSVFWNTARPAFSLQSRTEASPPSTLRSAITTAAPSPANLIAVARPMPLAAPVITATLPLSLSISDVLSFKSFQCYATRVFPIDVSSRPRMRAGNGALCPATFRALARLACKEDAAKAGEGNDNVEIQVLDSDCGGDCGQLHERGPRTRAGYDGSASRRSAGRAAAWWDDGWAATGWSVRRAAVRSASPDDGAARGGPHSHAAEANQRHHGVEQKKQRPADGADALDSRSDSRQAALIGQRDRLGPRAFVGAAGGAPAATRQSDGIDGDPDSWRADSRPIDQGGGGPREAQANSYANRLDPRTTGCATAPLALRCAATARPTPPLGGSGRGPETRLPCAR